MAAKVVVDCNEMARCYRWPDEHWISTLSDSVEPPHKLAEPGIPLNERLKVSDVPAPNEEGAFGQTTTLYYLMKNNDKYRMFIFNRELYQQTIDLPENQ